MITLHVIREGSYRNSHWKVEQLGIPGRAAGDNLAVHPKTRPWLSAESYWEPPRVVLSGWLEHAPFAAWLIHAQRPGTLVELGTHSGYSFFAFCQAVQRLGLTTRCFAIDTWEGDDHSGFYGGEVFEEVSSIAGELYAGTAVLLKGRFDDYVDSFGAGSIDLLHIDGRHGYEDVKHDFETWHPKVAPNGIVLFHDISVTEREFGVLQYWQEVSQGRPHFAFEHGNGLGVLANGRYSKLLGSLFEATGEAAKEIRDFYYKRGRLMTVTYVGQVEKDDELQAKDDELQAKDDELQAKDDELQARSNELDDFLRRRSWRFTRPLRELRSIPGRVRRIVGGSERG